MGKLIRNMTVKIRRFCRRRKYVLYYAAIDIILKNKIIVNYWIPPKTDPLFYNFGDDLNRILLELISGKKVIPYKYSIVSRFRKRVNYLCIGSIISQLSNEQSIIWGSGVLSPELPLTSKPFKVLAVRGPLSRDYLLKQGVDCPEVYGDPALLLPKFYRPASYNKKYKIGIIPHYTDKKNPLIDRYRQHSEVYVLDVQLYGSYKLFIDTICACEYIISSSLHGLIISDAYGIPNVWIQFSSGIIGGRFKFEDYFLSVKRPLNNLPIELRSFKPIEDLMLYCNEWRAPSPNLDQFMEVCPFKSNIH